MNPDPDENIEITNGEWELFHRYMEYAKKPELSTAEDEGNRAIALAFRPAVKTRILSDREPSPSEKQQGVVPQQIVDVHQVIITAEGLRLAYLDGHHRIKRQVPMSQVVSIEQALR